jgi:hypothetical protein
MSDHDQARAVALRQAGWVRLSAAAVGAVFLLVGIAGFVPGLTTNYDDLGFADHTSRSELLGVFQVSVLHNLVHLLFGVAGLVLARRSRWATHYLVWGGVAYLVLWVYGVSIDGHSAANFVPVNDADNWLHLALAVGMIGLGLVGRRSQIGPDGPFDA